MTDLGKRFIIVCVAAESGSDEPIVGKGFRRVVTRYGALLHPLPTTGVPPARGNLAAASVRPAFRPEFADTAVRISTKSRYLAVGFCG